MLVYYFFLVGCLQLDRRSRYLQIELSREEWYHIFLLWERWTMARFRRTCHLRSCMKHLEFESSRPWCLVPWSRAQEWGEVLETMITYFPSRHQQCRPPLNNNPNIMIIIYELHKHKFGLYMIKKQVSWWRTNQHRHHRQNGHGHPLQQQVLRLINQHHISSYTIQSVLNQLHLLLLHRQQLSRHRLFRQYYHLNLRHRCHLNLQ